jgi:endonuclease/exonuclease/phosphatase family metal-dependent hydrolase
MRLVTWNCFRGDLRTRAADVADLRPDLLVLQECARPTSSALEPAAWFGTNPGHGFGVVAREGIHLQALPQHESLDHSVFPLGVSGEHSFNLLGIWAKPAPTYVDSILRGLDVYTDVLRAAPTIVVGDFNSHARIQSCFIVEEPAGIRSSDHRPLVVDLDMPAGFSGAA